MKLINTNCTFFKILCIYFLIFGIFTTLMIPPNFIFAQTIKASIPKPGKLPLLKDKSVTLSDPSLAIEIFATGLKHPTNMAFLDSGDVLVLEKDNGTVKKIVGGNIMKEPMLDVNVANFDTRGMLGIAVAKNETVGKHYVFIYYTQAKEGKGDGEDKCFSPSKCIPGYLPNGNRLYRYELSEDRSKLINENLIFEWPPIKRADHNGGELIVGPSNNLYLIVGDGDNATKVLNRDNDYRIYGSGGILAFNHNGAPIFSNGLLGGEDPLNRYYAYGIRNGFGLDFDPVTGNLWDTENGPAYGDEINLVLPGFNSGWKEVQGLSELKDGFNKNSLEDFGGKGTYSDPEFTWNQTTAPTAIKFLNSEKYGKEYKNDIFVGSNNYNGNLYHFNLNLNRTGLELQGPLKDRIANNYEELSNVIFGKNFGAISDIEVGPDGYLYIVSYQRGEIFRIIPTNALP
jgi:glucose/arabinose dehydrogenase